MCPVGAVSNTTTSYASVWICDEGSARSRAEVASQLLRKAIYARAGMRAAGWRGVIASEFAESSGRRGFSQPCGGSLSSGRQPANGSARLLQDLPEALCGREGRGRADV